MEKLRITSLYQHIEIFPEVLGHESEEGEESPSKAVKACVTVVWVPSSFHTCEALWTTAKTNTRGLETQPLL